MESGNISEKKKAGLPKKVADAKTLEEICEPALATLKTESKGTYEQLVSLMNEGILNHHLTKGNLNQSSDQLLAKLRGENDENQAN